MKVYIGPYKNWIGSYQIAGVLEYLGVSEDRCDSVGEWLENTWVGNFFQWFDKKKKRNITIRIDNYDTWGAYHTLALIILPVLKQLRGSNHGSCSVDDEDVPEHLKSTTVPTKENEWDIDDNHHLRDIDDNHHLRWEYVMDQMIFSFENIVDDSWEDQFHTGDIDFIFVKKTPDETDEEKQLYEMVTGPNDTHVFDREGYNAYQARITNGLKLFGKYYQSLWD